MIKMKIGLIPLDERPVNTRYPRMIAQIAGAELYLPPDQALSRFRTQADSKKLRRWLEEIAPHLDYLVASFEMLGYGSLISSRISHEPVDTIISRLQILHEIKKANPALKIIGFNLIMRISNANSAVEEPEYWATEGMQFFQFSQLVDRQAQGQDVARELEKINRLLPPEHVQDFLIRRLRNHTVNLAAIQMLLNGDLEALVLSSDDTSPYGLSSSEKQALAQWVRHVELAGRLLMYPGADEVGCALLARAVNKAHGCQPGFKISYAVPGGKDIVAPYEDSPVSVTLERQIRAVGGKVVDKGGDFWVAVNPPSPRRTEWEAGFAVAERQERLPYLQMMVDEIKRRLAAGQAVIVADVAYPNGADPLLIELLLTSIDITQLSAYGAWNTAGNTIGTALAQACTAHWAESPEQREAQQRFLLHRFLEDWGYQQEVREETRQWMEGKFKTHSVTAKNYPQVLSFISNGLQRRLDQLPDFAGKFQLAEGSLRLPWDRLFEVDFELERVK
jgi:hypothetical protein